jgi:hypothetical protein
MFKILSAHIVLILSFPVCIAQVPEDFPFIDKNELPGAKFTSSRTFNGTSLFGYINGGAELYLEYGFDAARITEIEYSGGKYKTEIYKMKGPEEAFGIFSVSKYRCRNMPSLSSFTCQTKYQLQICKGPYYISIINGTGTGSDSIASLKIGEIIVSKIQDKEIILSSYLPDIQNEIIQTKCFLAKGRLGIVNGSPELEDFFHGMTGYTAVIMNDSDKTIVSVKFSDGESYQEFHKLHQWEVMNGTLKEIHPAAGITATRIAENHLLIRMTKQ